MSLQVMAWVMEHSPDTLNGTEQSVALALANYADDQGGRAFPSVAKLCQITHWTERTVVRALDSLEEKGVIEIERTATNKLPASYCFPAFRDVRESPQQGKPRDVTDAPQNTLGVSESPSRGVRNAPKPSVNRIPSTTDTPYGVFAAVCEEAGLDASAFRRNDVSAQCKVAQRLMDDELTADEARAITRYLRGQSWRTDPVTMWTVQRELGKWRAAGRPEQEKTRRPKTQAELNKGGTGRLVS